MTKIICSHGFGVKADARGMFTDIAKALPEHEFVMFNYNKFDADGNTIVESLDVQASKLQDIIDAEDEGTILLCHSQGSIIAGLVDISKIRKVILLAPPVKMSMERIIEKMMKKSNSEIDLAGVSKLPRSDGTFTYLLKTYIESLDGKDPIKIYCAIASVKPTVVIRALNDEVLGATDVEAVTDAEIINITADHNFTGVHRIELISRLKLVLAT